MAKLPDQLSHLKKDKALKKVIHQVGEVKLKRNIDLYHSLLRAIVGQQLSMKAADTIWNRFLELFNGEYPSAEKVIRIHDDRLRAVGLSYQKAGYIKNIARFSLEKTLDYKKLRSMPDEELIEYLVQIKGVGRWTVEMILMFNLNRPDIFPKDDLGIQNGIISLYEIKVNNKKELFSRMERVAESWKPFRSLACMYIWRHKDSLTNKKAGS